VIKNKILGRKGKRQTLNYYNFGPVSLIIMLSVMLSYHMNRYKIRDKAKERKMNRGIASCTPRKENYRKFQRILQFLFKL